MKEIANDNTNATITTYMAGGFGEVGYMMKSPSYGGVARQILHRCVTIHSRNAHKLRIYDPIQ